jgi:biotin transport system substrate-specific component
MTIKNAAAISLGVNSWIESLKIALGVLVLFAGSQIAIPLQPVPITMQTVAVMLIGLLYSKRAGLWSVILYTILGGLGLPMFQGFEGGLTHLYGPTAGYIFGFIVSIYVMATLRAKFNLESYWGILANCLVGTVVVFICGLSWLAAVIGFKDAIIFGLIPFIIPGALKAITLSGAVRFIRGA